MRIVSENCFCLAVFKPAALIKIKIENGIGVRQSAKKNNRAQPICQRNGSKILIRQSAKKNFFEIGINLFVRIQIQYYIFNCSYLTGSLVKLFLAGNDSSNNF